MQTAVGGGTLILFERITFFCLLFIAAGIAAKTLFRRFALVRSGRPLSEGREDPASRWKRLLRYVPGQWCNIQNISSHDLAGIQHLFLFFGAICLSIYYGIIVIIGDGLGISESLRQYFVMRAFVYATELFALLILIGLVWGLIRRAIIKPARLGPDFEVGTFLKITLGGSILMLCLFSLEALRVHLVADSYVGPISGMLLAPLEKMLQEAGKMERIYHLLWWAQAVFIVGFIIYVPFSKHQHALFSPLNIFSSAPKPKGRIEPIVLDNTYSGIGQPKDLAWKQLLELYACTQCGRCQDACPAQATGKPLSPKKIIQDLRKWMDCKGRIQAPWEGKTTDKNPGEIEVDDFISDEEIWSCTTCMACVQECPAFISAFDKIAELRRDSVLARGRIYPEVSMFFREVEIYGDTFGKGKALREDWILGRDYYVLTEDSEADVLFWVGCQSAFHDRNRSGATALFDILQRCGIDFAILGKGEMCCGDPLRRLGNEYVFQDMARKNIALLKKLKFNKIVTYCPHCFNMLKNEYAQIGGDFDVFHYTEFLKKMIQDGALKLNKTIPAKVAYHDPCYLARGNQIHSEPRQILASIAGTTLLETAHARTDTFCCGGGGGHMWMGGSHGERINERRVKELTADDAKTIITSCPYCVVMLEDGIKSLQMDTVKCLDLVEFIRDRI